MNIPPDKYKRLLAIDNKNHIVSIPNRVMRKQRWKKEQDEKLTPNSICIVCNFSYYYKDRGWSDNIGAICHPFREYNIPTGDKKLHLFSESDLCDSLWMPEISLLQDRSNYEYDFFCFTIDSSQGVKCKGAYALPLIVEVSQELNMRGLILDYYPRFPRPRCDSGGNWDVQISEVRSSLKGRSNIVIKRGWFDQVKISKLMNKCKFVIFPNTRDASPRTIPETLLRGKSLMMNKNILGGWKYINDTNGMLYDGAFSMEELKKDRQYYYDEIKRSLIEMRNRKFDAKSIKSNYMEKYGFINTTKRLASIINKIEGHKKYRNVVYTDFNKYLMSIL
jgi:hypothetical protein